MSGKNNSHYFFILKKAKPKFEKLIFNYGFVFLCLILFVQLPAQTNVKKNVANSLEKVNDLTDIIPLGAPEVFDDERTPLWTREVMRNHILKVRGGGNWSFCAAEVNGEKKIFALTATHVDSSPIGSQLIIGGDMFGFPTNGGQVGLEGTVKAIIGPGDPNSINNKFTVLEVTRYWGISGGELNPGANDYKTLRTFPLASAPIDTINPGYIGDFTQSGLPGPTFPNYDPALVGKFVSTMNLDPTGDQDSRTKMIMPDPTDPVFGGKTINVPMQIFHQDSTDIGVGSSGGERGQIVDPTLTPADMRQKDTDIVLAKNIVEDYRILGPIQTLGPASQNGDILNPGITLVQPYRSDIEAAIGGTLLDEAWDLEISGTGQTREVGKVVDGIMSIEEVESSGIPEGYTLEQNYPNPFNPSTKIRFAIPKSEHVTLKVYDVLGREVETLINGEEMHAGTYDVDFNGTGLASGLYSYRITAGTFIQTKKMILLK